MRLHALSNQWQTLDRLFERFDSHSDVDLDTRARMVRELLEYLESIDGPDVYIGTSHSQLNFLANDVCNAYDRVPTIATANVTNDHDRKDRWVYRISHRRIEGQRPTDEWVESDCDTVESAAKLLASAFQYANTPQRN